MNKKKPWPEWRTPNFGIKTTEEHITTIYSEFGAIVESDMAKKGWARTWQELEEKFADYPMDLIPDSVSNAIEFYISLQEAREALKKSPLEAALRAINFCEAIDHYFHEEKGSHERKRLSQWANAIKKDKREKLYALSLDKAKSLANNNPTWNNVQIAEEILKDETYETLSSRELKRRIRENFPDRQHRKKRK